MLGLVAVHDHRPQRRPPVDPVAHVRALVAPIARPRAAPRARGGRAARPAPPRRPPAPSDREGAGVGRRLVTARRSESARASARRGLRLVAPDEGQLVGDPLQVGGVPERRASSQAQRGRRSPSMASPTLPGLTKRQPPTLRTRGRWVWPLTMQSGVPSSATRRARSRSEVWASMASRGSSGPPCTRATVQPFSFTRTTSGQPGEVGEALGAELVGASRRASRPARPWGGPGRARALGDLAVGVAHHAGPADARGPRRRTPSGSSPRITRSPVQAPRVIPASVDGAENGLQGGGLAWTSPEQRRGAQASPPMPEGRLQAGAEALAPSGGATRR